MFNLNNKILFFSLIALHVFVGALGEYAPSWPGYFYLAVFIYFAFDVVRFNDSHSRAGFYALYLMGFEIVYRISGTSISYETGKYFSLLILLVGLIVNKRKEFPWVFLLLLLLLLPSVFLADDPDPTRIRKIILFNISGPLSLILSGLYFFKRRISFDLFFKGLRFAFLPAFSLVVLLSLKSGLSELHFTGVDSSSAASGGFGANQVSTLIGWFILMLLLARIRGKILTPFVGLDWGMIGILFIRGLITFSRGGIMSMFLAIVAALVILWTTRRDFRHNVMRKMPYILLGLVFISGVVLYTNHLTNNFLLYRYEGKRTSEITTGIAPRDRDYLTGRGDIMKGDIAAFKTYPILGVGTGMAVKWHSIYFGHDAAAHTEYSRLLSESGVLGLIYILIAFIVLPLWYFHRLFSGWSKAFFAAFLLISMFTMFHAAMRLAMPGIVYGLSFLILKEERREGLEKKRIKD